MNKPKIAIIGGGSSGLFLANLLSKEVADVYILEKNNKLGKKILASGNGKCNFSNVYDLKNKYNNILANKIIEKYSVAETLENFKNNGLIYKNDELGRCYPVSECASSVLDCLKKSLQHSHILLETEVKNIVKKNNRYYVEYKTGGEFFDYVVCCSGSMASNLGSSKAYDYLRQLNVEISDLKASLTPVIVSEDLSLLKGVRVKCNVKLLDKQGCVCYYENGEILFKEDALSGIAVFNASSIINRKNSKYKIVLDLSCGMSEDELRFYIRNNSKDVSNMFKGFLNDKLAEYILKRIPVNNELTEESINKIIKEIYYLSFNVKGLYPLKEAQVCSGGIKLSQINENLELNKYPNVYVAGELLDIDGISGGYNLQFAWSSAGVIANDIIRKLSEGKNYEKK